MAKTVIALVKELKAKNHDEVVGLLRAAGFDVDAEGFGPLTKIDDVFVAKLHDLREGNGKTVAKAVSRRRITELDEPIKLDLGAPGIKRAAPKDFFGAKKTKPPVVAAPAELDAEGKPQVAEPRPKPKPQPAPKPAVQPAAGAAKPPAKAQPAKPGTAPKPARPARGPEAASTVRTMTPQDDAARGRRPARPDLSRGPRIISMPDPQEQARLRAQREARAQSGPAAGGTAVATDSTAAGDKKHIPGRGRPDKRKEVEAPKKRKIKEIGVAADEERVRSRKRVFKVPGKRPGDSPAVVPHIKISGSMTLRDVAHAVGVKVNEIVRFLMHDLGVMANINYLASVDEIQLIAENFGVKHTVSLDFVPEDELVQFEAVDALKVVERPPVVTVMGHVDHGKTKLLDAIRTTNVVAGEAGGITQHIGAYQVVKKGKHITFIDTPGHEAFTAMRARGSQVTDIVVLVVAADDGVMPQTVEAIDHARAAKVPIIVAVNKVDKPDANPDRVMNQLGERGLVPEAWGGDTVFVNVSALKQTGIDDLLEMILLTAELVDPKSDPSAPPTGVVIESKVDIGIGVVATVLVQQGTMGKGQFLLSGTHIGRIKRMENDLGVEVDTAPPSYPVRIIGFSDPPENGDKVYAFKSKKQANAIAEQRLNEQRVKAAAGASGRMSLEAFFKKVEAGEIKDLNILIKADVGGSAEALSEALKRIEVKGATCNIVSVGVGQINDSDVNLAAASGAVIIGFSVSINSTAKRLIEREHVDVRLYDVIYKVTEDIELAMKGLLEPVFEEKALGRVEVRAVFKQDKGGMVVGAYVLDGLVRRGSKYRVKRAGENVHEGLTLHSLKRFKDDVREVASGYECGLFLETTDIKEGDVLEVYEMVEKPLF